MAMFRDRFNDYLMAEVRELKAEVVRRDQIILTLINRPPQMMEKPIMIPPPQQPDLAALIRGMGEAFATTLNGQPPQQEDVKVGEALKLAMQDLNDDSATSYPDIEFDDYMDPTPPQSAVPTGPGQTPVHAIIDGNVRRMDGTPMFQAGDGLTVPVGGG